MAKIKIGVLHEDILINVYEIVCQLFGTMDFVIKEGFVIDPDIVTLKLKIIEVLVDITQKLDIENLNVILGTATGFIKNYVNQQAQGIKINGFEQEGLFVDLNQTTLSEHNHYLMFKSSPKFIHTKTALLYSEGPVYVP